MKIHHLIIVAASFAASLPAGAQERRELGAHEHGTGRLNIAIEGKRVSMELEVPSADIVGFEHAAKTAAQKTAIKQARATLKNALDVFKLPAEAKCKVAKADIEVHAEGEDDHKDKHKHSHDKASHDHAKEEAEDHDDGHAHSEFHAEYALDCAAPAKLTGIDFRYFTLFPGAAKLQINLVGEKGQTQYEVTREKPRVAFDQVG